VRVAKIVVCSGDFGSGKSNFASYLAVSLARRYNAPLWANYSLRGSVALRKISDLYECRSGVLVFDELHDLIDSRQSSGTHNAEFLEWFMQSRKLQSDIIICTQVLDQIDKRVRRMCKAEFAFQSLGEHLSQVETFRIDLMGERCERINSRVWDRRLAYGLYDHLERAWVLEAAPKPKAGAAVKQVAGAPAPLLVGSSKY
jgi:hypothetical protein